MDLFRLKTGRKWNILFCFIHNSTFWHFWWVMWCLTGKEAESLELQRISASAYYAGSGQDFFSSLREIRFFHHFKEDQEQLFGGLVSAQLDGAVAEPESHHLLDRCGDNG